MSTNTYLTPTQLAKRWGVAVDKIYDLIATGQLPAINVAVKPNGKPRYRIPPDAIAAFESARSVGRPKLTKQRRRRHTNVVEYF